MSFRCERDVEPLPDQRQNVLLSWRLAEEKRERHREREKESGREHVRAQFTCFTWPYKRIVERGAAGVITVLV